jgi:hypothetical protein
MSETTPSQGLSRSVQLRNAKLAQDPTCRVCGETKTVEDFPRRAVDYTCTKCRGIDAIRRYHARRNAMTADELSALRAAINARQTAARRAKLASMSAEEEKEYRERINAGNAERRYAARDAAYRAYGGYRCACCGETERAFLSIDHVHNDGAEHKRRFNLRTGEQLYRWLARHKFPPGFQILCMNCQWGKRNNNGICPHQTSKV